MLGNSDGYMRFQLEDVRVYAGDEQAFVTCVEVIDAADTRGRCSVLQDLLLMLVSCASCPGCCCTWCSSESSVVLGPQGGGDKRV